MFLISVDHMSVPYPYLAQLPWPLSAFALLCCFTWKWSWQIHSPGSFANCLLLQFTQWEALGGDWRLSGKTLIYLPFLALLYGLSLQDSDSVCNGPIALQTVAFSPWSLIQCHVCGFVTHKGCTLVSWVSGALLQVQFLHFVYRIFFIASLISEVVALVKSLGYLTSLFYFMSLLTLLQLIPPY